MAQRIFDMRNEQDVEDLFNILPDWVNEIKNELRIKLCGDKQSLTYPYGLINIQWGNKLYVSRPIDESKWIGCLCWFWDSGAKRLGVLKGISDGKYCKADTEYWYGNCRPVKREEVKFVGDGE